MNYGIHILKLKEIVGRAAIENHASVNVLQKAGLSFLKEDVEHGDKLLNIF